MFDRRVSAGHAQSSVRRSTAQKSRRGPESNRRIRVLQTLALPLGYRAVAHYPESYSSLHGRGNLGFPLPEWNERNFSPARFIREGKTSFSLPEPILFLKGSLKNGCQRASIGQHEDATRGACNMGAAWEQSLNLAVGLKAGLPTDAHDADAIGVVPVFILGERLG